jgi:hypothetical protein
LGTCFEKVLPLKGDTAAIILDGVKIVQKCKQQSIENKTKQQNKYQSSIIVTNFHLFYKNNAFPMTLLLLCYLCLPSRVVLPGHLSQHAKKQTWPLLMAKHFQTQVTKKVLEIYICTILTPLKMTCFSLPIVIYGTKDLIIDTSFKVQN